VAVAAFDREMRYLQVSERWCSDFRIDESMLAGRSHFDLFPDLRVRWQEACFRVLHGARERCEEDLLPCWDGSREFMQWEMAPWFDPCGAVAGVILTTHVITARKRMEAELSRIKHAAACATSEPHLLDEICEAAVQVGGYRAAWVGFAEDDPEKSVRRAAVAGVEGAVIDSLGVTWSGAERGTGPTGTAIRTGKASLARDLRSNARIECWRKAANHEGIVAGIGLPLVVGERVLGALTIYASETDCFDSGEIELLSEFAASLVMGIQALRDRDSREQAEQHKRALEDQLRQAQKMEALGTLAGGIAHDFNNILTGIIGNLQLAEMDLPEGHEAGVALAEAGRASRRARDLVARILTFSRREQDDRQVCELGPIIEEAVHLIRASIPCTIEIRASVAPDGPSVLCSSAQIHQVIMNLCTNAAHAMRERGGLLTVEFRTADPSRAILAANPRLGPGCPVLSVSDTGCGMDATVMKRIFEPFFTTKAVGEGTGLGLAMVQRIVHGHGGSVDVRSEPGTGTRFDIYLPPTAGSPA
jgi:PAS domain S-box-containing protein